MNEFAPTTPRRVGLLWTATLANEDDRLQIGWWALSRARLERKLAIKAQALNAYFAEVQTRREWSPLSIAQRRERLAQLTDDERQAAIALLNRAGVAL